MPKPVRTRSHFANDARGATSIEYALIAVILELPSFWSWPVYQRMSRSLHHGAGLFRFGLIRWPRPIPKISPGAGSAAYRGMPSKAASARAIASPVAWIAASLPRWAPPFGSSMISSMMPSFFRSCAVISHRRRRVDGARRVAPQDRSCPFGEITRRSHVPA